MEAATGWKPVQWLAVSRRCMFASTVQRPLKLDWANSAEFRHRPFLLIDRRRLYCNAFNQ